MGRAEKNLLTDIQLKKWVRAGSPVAKSDGGGLTFTLSPAGTATWVMRYRFGGRRQEVTLGRYPEIGLAAARLSADRKRVALADGIDPADAVRKVKSRQDWTVRDLAKDYRTLVLVKMADSTQKSYERNLKRIENGMGSMSVQSVGPVDVVAQIERVKAGWVEVFTLWCVLRGIFKHAAGKRLISSTPCAGINLESIIGTRPDIRTRLMLSAEEIGVLMNATMNKENLLSAQLLLATGARASELFTALRSNVFVDDARWHIPKSKTGAAMDIPLAPVVVKWFKDLFKLAGNSDYVLPARLRTRFERADGDAHVSKDALREAIDFWIENYKPNIRRFTPHDLRSTMKSHMRRLGISSEVSEMCLNHKLQGVEGIYDQHNYYEERRAALELWAHFIVSCQTGKPLKASEKNRRAVGYT